MKVLVATEKPFAKIAVDGIRKEIEAAGYELVLLEKYGEKAKLLEAVVSVGKSLYKIFAMAKTAYDFIKPYAIIVWEWLS